MAEVMLTPAEAGAKLAERIDELWAEALCAQLLRDERMPLTCRIVPNVARASRADRSGLAEWTDARLTWQKVLEGELGRLAGAAIEDTTIGSRVVPKLLTIDSIDVACEALQLLGPARERVDIARARRIGVRLRDADTALSPGVLREIYRLDDENVTVVLDALDWLRVQPDLGEWTARQLLIPGSHSKWFEQYAPLLERLTGRLLRREVKPRPAIVHFSYADPGYLARGLRRHDSWTSNDVSELPYAPRVVVIVENRDCRLEFPEYPNTVVLEGSGDFAPWAVARIDWLETAERVIYWGDIDVDGFAILDRLRVALSERGIEVQSMLMDLVAHARYASHGTNRDSKGVPLQPSMQRLHRLEEHEREAFDAVATRGSVAFRRIEQERIPAQDVVEALRRVLDTRDRSRRL